jgi:hypothetical protein
MTLAVSSMTLAVSKEYFLRPIQSNAHQGLSLHPFVFMSLNQLTPIINLCPIIISLMFFGWLILQVFFKNGNIIFYLHPFDLCPLFQTNN